MNTTKTNTDPHTSTDNLTKGIETPIKEKGAKSPSDGLDKARDEVHDYSKQIGHVLANLLDTTGSFTINAEIIITKKDNKIVVSDKEPEKATKEV